MIGEKPSKLSFSRAHDQELSADSMDVPVVGESVGGQGSSHRRKSARVMHSKPLSSHRQVKGQGECSSAAAQTARGDREDT